MTPETRLFVIPRSEQVDFRARAFRAASLVARASRPRFCFAAGPKSWRSPAVAGRNGGNLRSVGLSPKSYSAARLRGSILPLFAISVFGLCLAAGMARAREFTHQANNTSDASEKLAQGKKLFYARCGFCHLAGGTGTIMLGRRLGKDRALLEQRTDLSADYIKKITRVGINGMPPHNRIEVPDSELDLIALYLTRPASAREASTASAPPNGGRP